MTVPSLDPRGFLSEQIPSDVIDVVESYLNPRALTFADWARHGGEMLVPSLLAKRLGLYAPPMPNAEVGLWMSGDDGYGAGIFLARDDATGELHRARRAPNGTTAEHDVIRIGWRDADAIFDAESVIKAIVIHKATGFPVLANNGIRGWSNSRFHKGRVRGDGTVRELVLYDSLLPDLPEYAKRRQAQLEAERLRCRLSVEQGYVPYVVRLPDPPPVTGEVQWGVDDYAARYGPDALAAIKAKAIRYVPPPPPAEFEATTASFANLFSDDPPAPEFIVANLMPLEVGVISATGGMGKTTLVLWLAIHIAIGRPVFGHKIIRPGSVLFVTGEDNRQIFQHRLRSLCEQLTLSSTEKELVVRNVYVEDVSTRVARLAEADAHGNLSPTDLVDKLVASYASIAPSLVVLDPLISFSPGERYVNDGAQSLIIQARKLCYRLRAAVLLVNHVSKEHAQGSDAKQHAGRGGTAIGDGCRFEYELRRVKGKELGAIPLELMAADTKAHALYVHKLSHGPRPDAPYLFVRHGWAVTWVQPEVSSDEAQEDRRKAVEVESLDRDLGNVVQVMATLDLDKCPETARSLRTNPLIGLSKSRVEAVLAHGLRSGAIVERNLPAHQIKGAKKTGLYLRERKF